MIPVAEELIKRGHNVIFASGKEHISLIEFELPGCKTMFFPGFRPKYSAILPQYISLLFQIPVMFFHIISENRRLKKIIRENSIDLVISDNRFGLWNKDVKTVYVTHQIRIPFPAGFRFMEGAGVFLHRQIIKKYNYCFIPDLPGEENISGRLSHKTKLPGNIRYIGLLSRFSRFTERSLVHDKTEYSVVILSGPEPQKGILGTKLSEILKKSNRSVYFLEGSPGAETAIRKSGNITYCNHLSSEELWHILRSASSVICRSGYSTIMDLVVAGKTALLIPTPGQTEQEYLAEHLAEKGWFSSVKQKALGDGLLFDSEASFDYKKIIDSGRGLLDHALDEILDQPHKQSQSGKSG